MELNINTECKAVVCITDVTRVDSILQNEAFTLFNIYLAKV